MIATQKTKRSLAAHKANWTRKLKKALPAPATDKDERATAILARHSTALLELTLLDRAMDRVYAEIDRLESVIDVLQEKQDRQIAERKKVRIRYEAELATTKGGAR